VRNKQAQETSHSTELLLKAIVFL